jgi:hypothetical protein
MTLIVSVLTQDYVIQVSDRCMTIERGDGKRRYEEGHNKAVLFEHRIAFGYTGQGEIDGRPTDEWLQEHLGKGTDVASGLQSVLDGLKRGFPPASEPHAFVAVGWGFVNEPVPFVHCISNFVNAAGESLRDPQPTFSAAEATLAPGAKAFVHQLPERIVGQDWARLEAQVVYVVEQGNGPAAMADVLVEAVRRVASDDEEVGSGLMINCLPFTVATGSDGGFALVSRPTMHHSSFAYLAPGETEPGGLGPLRVSAEQGWLASGFRHEFGPAGEESVEVSFKLTREGATPPGLVMRYQQGPSPPPRRVGVEERIGRNDACYCGSGKKFKKCHGAHDTP